MNSHHRQVFPADFVWGAATSAYQIEGSTTADGRGQSIWDRFAATPGRVIDGSTGDIATDSYRRIPEDVALMRELGLTAYRFSVSWPRIHPEGDAKVNQAGIDYYRRLVDELLGAGIEPWITLYHWDLPQALEDKGGWPARDTAYRFAEYATTVHGALGDRVNRWITVNEPWCAAFLGYASGEHAPGRRDPADSIRAAHHLMLGHGLAVQALRAQKPDDKIAVGLNFYPVRAVSEEASDVDAARRIDGLQNRFFTQAALGGSYPADVLADLSEVVDLDFIRDGDLAEIHQPIDALCVNYYSSFNVTGNGNGKVSAAAAPTDAGSPWPGSGHVAFQGGGLPVTGMGWEIDADGLRSTLVRLSEEYPGLALIVSENGAAFEDAPANGGPVADPDRRAYFEVHLQACADAIAAGVPLGGYFAWSLMDNFEWAWGYTKRFGLVHVDFDTQHRTIKESGRWYADWIRAGIGRNADSDSSLSID
ncbi:GH1 family beta-glucosidase [Phytomonospora sp. NPDC050363]|uniref:GH1 family beta-glucosidase n=1 Tax=Phytomonospora sp. NPDC050363 TaxID=3155642 RepID=UPI0033CF15A2